MTEGMSSEYTVMIIGLLSDRCLCKTSSDGLYSASCQNASLAKPRLASKLRLLHSPDSTRLQVDWQVHATCSCLPSFQDVLNCNNRYVLFQPGQLGCTFSRGSSALDNSNCEYSSHHVPPWLSFFSLIFCRPHNSAALNIPFQRR